MGISAAILWILGQVCGIRFPDFIFRESVVIANNQQALWLHQGYNLEFLGRPSFVPGLYLAGLFFFCVNVWILGIIVQDGSQSVEESELVQKSKSP